MIWAMSRRVGSRALAVGSLAAGIAIGAAAVISALGAPAPGLPEANAASPSVSRTVSFGAARVAISAQPNGTTCVRVGAARSCGLHLTPNAIGYVIAPGAVGGAAGGNVQAVIVRLTRKGTVWAMLKRGAFYAAIPSGYRVRALVKVLRGGERSTFKVTASR
jgi:hypothetical protein